MVFHFSYLFVYAFRDISFNSLESALQSDLPWSFDYLDLSHNLLKELDLEPSPLSQILIDHNCLDCCVITSLPCEQSEQMECGVIVDDSCHDESSDSASSLSDSSVDDSQSSDDSASSGDSHSSGDSQSASDSRSASDSQSAEGSQSSQGSLKSDSNSLSENSKDNQSSTAVSEKSVNDSQSAGPSDFPWVWVYVGIGVCVLALIAIILFAFVFHVFPCVMCIFFFFMICYV